jgi:putative AdoMet-dependent methyltransferase
MTRHEFIYDEMHQAGADHSDPERVRTYDQLMERFRDYQAEVERVAQLLSLRPGHTLLDIGAGSGALAIGLAKRCRHVTAVDISPGMLDLLAAKAQEADVRNVKTVNAGYLTFDADGAQFDRIISNVVLHHLPDFWKTVALSRMRDMLACDGLFYLNDVVFSFEAKEYEERFTSFVDDIAQKSGPGLVADAILHLREEFSTFDWVLDAIIDHAGLAVVDKTVRSPTTVEYLLRRHPSSANLGVRGATTLR